ncbi:hypothetical protein [Hoyosella sp. YIM 151337]|uniref:hypothetical protein n=1 Tax=Hoyosella sp. YIM 151337 TaxID=2992742 RepID=UPI002235EA8D|nr:hypothetical protein [Hoyosella sp. YIM 151337]
MTISRPAVSPALTQDQRIAWLRELVTGTGEFIPNRVARIAACTAATFAPEYPAQPGSPHPLGSRDLAAAHTGCSGLLGLRASPSRHHPSEYPWRASGAGP